MPCQMEVRDSMNTGRDMAEEVVGRDTGQPGRHELSRRRGASDTGGEVLEFEDVGDVSVTEGMLALIRRLSRFGLAASAEPLLKPLKRGT